MNARRFRPSSQLQRLLKPVRASAEDPVYLVGGSLRDALMKRTSADLDLAVVGSAEMFARRLARELKSKLVVLDEETRVYRIVLPASAPYVPWRQIDVAQAQGPDIETDLLRRDFTINAMAWPLKTLTPTLSRKREREQVIDPRGGLQDIKRKKIRADRPRAFREDPLRLLRAFRQAAQLDFTIDPATLKHIRSNRQLVKKPAGERIRQELIGIFSSPIAHAWLEKMDEAGLLSSLFPHMEQCRRCAVVYYGKGGVLRHMINTVARLDFLFANLAAVFPDIHREIRADLCERMGSMERAMPLLRLTALLHDISKPATARKVGGRLRFFGHDTQGADEAAKLLANFRFSRQEIAIASACIRYHLRPGNLAANLVISDKAAFRFFQDVGRDGVSLLLVCWADHASYLEPAILRRVLRHVCKDPHQFALDRIKGESVRKTLHHLQCVGYLLRSYFKRIERVRPTPLLNGHAIMKALKLEPGPMVGKALESLQEAQAEGKVTTRADAIQFLNNCKKLRVLAR